MNPAVAKAVAPHAVKIAKKLVIAAVGMVVAGIMGFMLLVAAVFGGSFGAGGAPANTGVVGAPQAIVVLDVAAAAAAPCQVPPSLLLAQQYVESGYQATVVSSAGAVGLAQFEPATFAEYDQPVPAAGATPPTPTDPTDSAYAEARYLCSLGVATNPTSALIAYNCGAVTPACVLASSGYAGEILSLAATMSVPAPSTTTTSVPGAAAPTTAMPLPVAQASAKRVATAQVGQSAVATPAVLVPPPAAQTVLVQPSEPSASPQAPPVAIAVPTAAPAPSVPPTAMPDPAATYDPPAGFADACLAGGGGTSPAACDGIALAGLNQARAGEGLPAMVLPAGYEQLSPTAQSLWVINSERTVRGLRPVAETTAVDSAASAGAAAGADPTWGGAGHWMSIWGDGYMTPLSIYLGYIYIDGPPIPGLGTKNIDCMTAGAAGCWGHRHAVLDPAATTVGVAWIPATGTRLSQSAAVFVGP